MVTGSDAVYRFTNVGAAPVAVTLVKYPARAAGTTGAVALRHGTDPLLRFLIVSGRDTLPLDRTAFRGALAYAADSTAIVTYAATIGTTPVSITYTVPRTGYMSRVSGTVGATGEHAYLLIGLPSGLNSYEADTLDDERQLAYGVKPTRENATSVSFSKLDPGEEKLEPGPITWAVVRDKYFVLGVLAPITTTTSPTPPRFPASPVSRAPTPSAASFAEVHLVGGPRTSKVVTEGSATVVQALTPAATGEGTGAGAGAGATFAFDLFAGPQSWRVLRAVGRDFSDVNSYAGLLHPILQPFVGLVIQSLIWLRGTLHLGYGWVVVIFGVMVRLLMWPFNQRAMRSSLKMQLIQPELQEVMAKHKNDRERQQAEQMRVYREHGMSPFSPLSGCLPMLLPMPVLFTLYFVFQNTIEFRGVPFLWMQDISVKDPYYILPAMVALTSFLVAWIGLRNMPPNPQSKMMAYLFPAMMAFFFKSLAGGLNLYYAVQNVAAVPQQWLIARERQKHRPPGTVPPPAAPSATPSPRPKRKRP